MPEKTILIVEDSLLNRRLVQAVLEPHGYRLLEAEDGESAIELAKTERPDLILMDILLPGMDGYEATRCLRADPITQGLTVVALTASASNEEQEQALAAGCDGHIPKPIDTRAFPQQIRQFLAD
jgi:two-component system cell cycle response regulator DivK